MWTRTDDELPPINKAVKTKIDDENGCRNETTLVLWKGLWWHPDKSMYVYYHCSH